MNQRKNPKWWNQEYDSSWERAKAAFQRDWDQTKHDMGGRQPDTNQDVDNTVKQAAGKEAIPPRGQPAMEKIENAYRFGHGARSHYGQQYAKWNNQLESQLQSDWNETYDDNPWEDQRDAIRRGWDFNESATTRKAA